MFANGYIQKSGVGKILPAIPPHPGVGMIVVIPAFREDDLITTLGSLQKCILPSCRVEVIILINHPEYSSENVKVQSQKTYQEVVEWAANLEEGGISFLVVKPMSLSKKWAGAGLARKRGMDKAVSRFNTLNKPKGLIVSLDADTLVDTNYLIEIEKFFDSHPKYIAATVAFEHQLSGLDELHRKGILLYERYLKYYKNALSFTGYPYSLFTIGSAFVVTAEAYIKRGGMNRRKAGEDFYFLQGLVQQGKVGEITATKVYPSARLSDRVPFGTGPILKKWIDGDEDLSKTYNFQAFADLKDFFFHEEKLYKITKSGFESLLPELPQSVSEFLKADDFFSQVNDLNRNCSSLQVFNKRFFHVFNAFKILKFLNYSHGRYYEKANITEQERCLSQNMNHPDRDNNE